MTGFIQLRNKNGKDVWINIDRIDTFYDDDNGGSSVFLEGEESAGHYKETPMQIINMIDKAIAKLLN